LEYDIVKKIKSLIPIFLMHLTVLNAQTPVLVKDIVSGPNASLPQYLTVFDGHLYFGTALTNGLWKTDGTNAGTVIAEGVGSIGNDFTVQLGVFDNQLYFNTFTNKAWWSTVGGIDNAAIVQNQLNTLGEITYNSSVLGQNVLVFAAADYSAAGNPSKLYRSDLTNAGTEEFGEFISDSSGPTPHMIGTVNSKLLFSAIETGQGRELYTTDATTGTTELLLEIRTGSIGGISDVSGANKALLNGEFYFPAFGDNGVRLWKTDATSIGTVELDDLSSVYSAPKSLNKFNNQIYFFADAITPPEQLFKIGSGDAHPTQLTDREPFSPSGCTSYSSMELNGFLYFSFADDSLGCELWKTDGTDVTLVKDINVGIEHSHPKFMESQDGWLYFTALKAGFGFELWKTDGTITQMVVDLNIGNGSSINNPKMVEYNGELYFIANDGLHGTELFKLKKQDAIFEDDFEDLGPI
jgi:ELWxxDGT repeat protein